MLILGVTGINQLQFGLWNLVGYFPLNGPNYGYYFVTLVIEVIFIFPILYILYLLKPLLALTVAVSTDFIFQFIAFYYISSFTYSVWYLRFVSALIIGLWISNKEFNIETSNSLSWFKTFLSRDTSLILLSIIGIIYLTLWYLLYMGYVTSIILPNTIF